VAQPKRVVVDSKLDGLALRFHSVDRVGNDLRLIARPVGRDVF
jgi:hypothetical protein